MEENSLDTNLEVKPKKFPTQKIILFILLTTIAFTLGYIHYRYVSVLFENDRNFSYLSELEREMSLPTEMGFYYSYYKTIVEERPFIAGISKLMYDKLVEYPKDVNAFNRFNIHPEVIIGAVYRYFEPWLNTSTHRQCHMVDRGDLSPVESCVGIGEPIFFYLQAIWILAGLTVAAIFLHAVTLSHSILGGFLAVAQYFANHAECTRIMWSPNERENFALPLLILQSWLLTMQLRDEQRKAAFQLQVSIFILNCLCLLFWQFSQFIFLTQMAIFFTMEQLRIIDIKSLCIFLHSHFCGLHMAVLLLQGNDMLKSSLYASFFISVSIYCLFFSSLRVKVQTRLDFLIECLLVLLRILIVVCVSLYLKKYISDLLEVEEDSHIWDILYSKFSNFKTFHTMLYTCSDVFNFLPLSSIANMTKTLLIPLAVLSCLNLCVYWSKKTLKKCDDLEKKEVDEKPLVKERDNDTKDDTDDSGIENNSETTVRQRKKRTNLDLVDKVIKSKLENQEETKTCSKDKFVVFFNNLEVDSGVFYNISQMVVYGIMALLVMRLKLLFATQMCVVASLALNFNTYTLPKFLRPKAKYLLVVILATIIPIFLYQMNKNINHELSHIGEFSDPSQEDLLTWISTSTSARSAFAGSMPVLAAVMLSTRRPIVAHPHYEHWEARQRAYSVYATYGRFTPQDLYHKLNKLQVTYLIIETKYCYGRSNTGCSFLSIWDIEVPSLSTEPSLCHQLLETKVEHFYETFRNQKYVVFRLHDLSIRYMPRSFDT